MEGSLAPAGPWYGKLRGAGQEAYRAGLSPINAFGIEVGVEGLPRRKGRKGRRQVGYTRGQKPMTTIFPQFPYLGQGHRWSPIVTDISDGSGLWLGATQPAGGGRGGQFLLNKAEGVGPNVQASCWPFKSLILVLPGGY